MKREDLEKLGLTKEQVDAVCDLNNKDVQPLKKDLEKTREDLKTAQEKVETTEEALKKFDGVDVEELKTQAADLKKELKKKDDEHAAALAERDFTDLLNGCITTAKGKNAKAIKALLDLDTLRASKNQKEDLEKSLKALSEAEDSKMLFGESDGKPAGSASIIGRVDKGVEKPPETMRSAIAEHYNVQ